MRILLSNQDLSRYGGTQLFTADLARRLLQWGHEPVMHSPRLGAVSNSLREWTVAATADLSTIAEAPDVIVGNYHLGTMTALHQFPSTPAVFVCHSPDAIVPRSPRIRRYVAVDEACRSHLVFECGIDPQRVELILSAVDLARFPARGELPPKPRHALIFGNEFSGLGPWTSIRTVCRELGLEVDVAGEGAKNVTEKPESLLLQYDVVFARGRSALEAMASGAATILAGPKRLGGLVTSETVAHLRPMNFGRRALITPTTPDAVRRELARYDPADALAVCRAIRETASLDLAAAQFVRVAEEAMRDATPADLKSEYAATAAYLASLEHLQRPGIAERIGAVPLVGPLAVWLGRRVKRALGR